MVIPKDELWEDFQEGNLLEKYIVLFMIAEQHYLRPQGKRVLYFSLFLFWAAHGVSLAAAYTSMLPGRYEAWALLWKAAAGGLGLYGFMSYLWQLDQEGELEKKVEKVEEVFPDV